MVNQVSGVLVLWTLLVQARDLRERMLSLDFSGRHLYSRGSSFHGTGARQHFRIRYQRKKLRG